MHILNRRLKYYIKKLENHQPFTVARYGDGEWRTILQGQYKNQRNSNGCTFTPALGRDLARVVKNQHAYDYGILRIARNHHADEINAWLQRHNVLMSWVNGDVMLGANLSGDFWPVVRALKDYRILYVGPKHCRGLHRKGLLNYYDYIEPPRINAHKEKHRIIPLILDRIKRHKIDLVGYSSGLAAKVFIDRVFEEYGDTVTQIDFGSMWDGYFSIGSRSYVRRGRVLWGDLLTVNTGKRRKRKGEKFRK